MDPTPHLNLARQRMQSGHFAGAAAASRAALQAQPTNADATYLLGLALLQQNGVPEAAEWLARAAAMLPDMTEPHANLNHALRLLGRVEEAAASLEQAIALRFRMGRAPHPTGAVVPAIV